MPTRKKPSQELLELSNHLCYIYTESKTRELGQDTEEEVEPELYKVAVSPELLKEWDDFIDEGSRRSGLGHLVKPNILYTNNNKDQADEWISIMFNGGALLGTLANAGHKFHPARQLHLEAVGIKKNRKVIKDESIEMF